MSETPEWNPETDRWEYRRTCICGTEFITHLHKKMKHTKDCGRVVSYEKRGDTNQSRKNKRGTELAFIGVDGEGVGRPDGRHEYVMLSVGSETLHLPQGKELTHHEIFPYLYAAHEANPYAAFIGFFLKYDFIQWTKSLPKDAAFQLWDKGAIARRKPTKRKNPDPFPVVCDGWEFDILAGRRFRLRPHACKKKLHKDECVGCDQPILPPDGLEHVVEAFPDGYREEPFPTPIHGTKADWTEFVTIPPKPSGWMYICDTGGFWQSSLMTALNPKSWLDPVCTPEEYETLKAGKAQRDITVPYGDATEFPRMIKYNILENEVLSRMTTVLHNGFQTIELTLRKAEWYGPGRVAQLWLDSVNRLLGDGGFDRVNITETLPEYAIDAGRKCYYGGWFEQFIHGHIPGTIHEYDINSAYPYIISTLPCLLHGTWSHGTGNPRTTPRAGNLRMFNARVRGTNPFIGAAPFRTSQGRILRPNHVTGWYWEHEIDASRHAGLIDEVEVYEWVAYDPCGCPPPLAGIADLYQARLLVDKNSPQGRGYKLVYNSSYGKMAQSIGEPKFSNGIYASLITAGCRVLILDAIATHPQGAEAVSMVATDGIYFTSPHPTLPLSDTILGKWGYETHENLTQFMPGVYWDDATRNRIHAGGLPKLKSRGINASDLARSISDLDRHFNSFDGTAWPTFDISTSFDIVSCSQAIQRGKWETAGVVTKGKTRHIDSDPRRKRTEPYLSQGMVRTKPYNTENPLNSVPYNKSFGQDLRDMQLLGESVSPDGDNDDLLAWLLNGTDDIIA